MLISTEFLRDKKTQCFPWNQSLSAYRLCAGSVNKCTKIYDAHARLLCSSSNHLFGGVLVAVAVNVCLIKFSITFKQTTA